VLYVDLYSIFLGPTLAKREPAVEVHLSPAPHDAWVALLNDGLHLSEAGNRLVASSILSVLPVHLQPDSLPLDFPVWRELPTGGDVLTQALAAEAMATFRATGRPL
jgi:hypothetical protein